MFGLFTSTSQVMFSPDLVDLSVCLCVTNIASKVHGFDEIFRMPSTSQHHSALFCTYTPDLFHCSIVSKNCSYPLDDLSVSCICTAVTGVSVLVLDSLNPPHLLKCLSGKDTPKCCKLLKTEVAASSIVIAWSSLALCLLYWP